MNGNRRNFLKISSFSLLATQLPVIGSRGAASPTILQKPPRLKIGDTIGLVSPASPIEKAAFQGTTLRLTHYGFNVKAAPHVLDEYGYLAGKDADRAADLNDMFADDSVQAILATRGGWGCNRILPLLDYELIRRHPKIFMGYSDITALLLAIYCRSGVITFHGPLGNYAWSEFSLHWMRQIFLDKKTVTLRNLDSIPVVTITPGKARGNLLGGNLSVMAAMVGSSYLPNWEQTILFVEDIGEDIYRIDRMLTQLKLAGILDKIAGFILGQCTKCTAGEDDDPSLTLWQVLVNHIKPLGIPAWYGSMVGHIVDQFVMPIGIKVEIDAVQGTITLLEAAVV